MALINTQFRLSTRNGILLHMDGIRKFSFQDYYKKSFTEKSWNYLFDNCVVYPDINRFTQDISNSLYPDLFIESYNELKKQGKDFIVIIEDTEGHWMGCKLHINLHKVLEKTKIPPKKILLITNDELANKKYNNWCETENIKEKINFISCQCLIQRHLWYNNTNEKWHDWMNRNWSFTANEEVSKKFICLMGVKYYIRDEMWNFYESNKFVKEQGHISYLAKNVILPNSWQDVLNGEERIKNAESSPQNDNLVDYHKDSYFSVLLETSQALWFTEKIMKPLLHAHPFMVFNSEIGHLKLLKRYGFETFPEWFDESYDEIEDIDERLNFIKKEIVRLCNISNKDLYKMYKGVEDKLIHNRNNILNFSITIEKQFINDLKNLVEKQR